MRICSVPPLLLALLLAIAHLLPVRAADEAGDRYLQAFQSAQAAEKLENEGKYDEALQKFRFCINVLEQIQRTSPDYYPILIDSRLKKSRAAIERISNSQQAPPAPDLLVASAPMPPPPQPVDRPPSSGAPRFGGKFNLDYRPGGAGASAPPSMSQRPDPVRPPRADYQINSSEDPIVTALKNEILRVNRLNQNLAEENDELRGRILESQAEALSNQKEVDLWKVRSAEQQSQIAQMHQSLEDTQQAVNQLSRAREADQKEIAALQAEVDAAKADLEVAEEYNGELFDKLTAAAKYIEESEKIREQLLSERKELNTRVNAKGDPKLRKDLEAAVAKNEDLQKKLEATEKTSAERNQDLTAKLAAAEQQLAELGKNKEERQKIETDLRAEVASVNGTLANMKTELDAGRKKIAELEKQLSATATASATVTGQMAEENALLKSVVARQLKEQAKRQQARKLVEEEMEKLKIRSGTLLEKLDAMAGADAELTAEEKKVAAVPAAPQGAHSEFALQVVKETPDSDLPADLVEFAAEANKLSQQQKYAEARAIYAEIAQKAPGSFLAAVNLGIAERQLGNYPQAIIAFKQALQLKPGEAYALTNLGTAQYRSGDLAAAATTLQQAVAADSESYLAHYLLGMTLNDQGDRTGAQREVDRSLELKSDYVPAKELAEELRKTSSATSTPQAATTQATP